MKEGQQLLTFSIVGAARSTDDLPAATAGHDTGHCIKSKKASNLLTFSIVGAARFELTTFPPQRRDTIPGTIQNERRPATC